MMRMFFSALLVVLCSLGFLFCLSEEESTPHQSAKAPLLALHQQLLQLVFLDVSVLPVRWPQARPSAICSRTPRDMWGVVLKGIWRQTLLEWLSEPSERNHEDDKSNTRSRYCHWKMLHLKLQASNLAKVQGSILIFTRKISCNWYNAFYNIKELLFTSECGPKLHCRHSNKIGIQ